MQQQSIDTAFREDSLSKPSTKSKIDWSQYYFWCRICSGAILEPPSVLQDRLQPKYNYILFIKLPRPGDSKGIFFGVWIKLPPAHCLHTQWRLHTIPLIAKHQAKKL